MNDWLHNLPVAWMALLVFGVTYLLALDWWPASRGAGFPAPPVAAKPGALPAHKCLWPDEHHGLEDRRTPAIKLDKEQAMAVRVTWTRPRTLRWSTISCRLSAASSASS